ncbi:MAG TPA: N-6 DNA methylase, partial [Candidatus Polarisedimenticolia bacterium]|nr:N-6 DNA methylase [Candidatus Polarisedimenticolia bacterium]
HATGEYYTPSWLVDRVLDLADFDGTGHARLLDPMCGGGAFLSKAIGRIRKARPTAAALEIASLVHGMDVEPVAVLMARAAYLEALAGAPRDGPLRIPVARDDAILSEQREPFDIVAGNPPWVGWESLSAEYRRRTEPLWRHHGLFPEGGGGMKAILGRGRKDLAMLATYAAADKFLAQGGRLAFVITRSVFKSVGGAAGFRRFRLGDGTPLGVVSVDDYGRRAVFAGTGARAAIVTMVKGEPTRYPVAYRVWASKGASPTAQIAVPVDEADPSSAWLTCAPDRLAQMRGLLGASDYQARAGAYTGGANGVYWVDLLEEGEADSLVRNRAGDGKRSLPSVTARVESELIYPLLRASDLGAGGGVPSAWILLPQDPHLRRGIPVEIMTERFPLALSYLTRFTAALGERRDRGTRSLLAAGAPFYTLFSVSAATLSPWKVVWPRIASRVAAAVVGPRQGRPVIPQETCTFIACGSRDEASYLAGVLGSDPFNDAAAAFAQTGGKGFGAPHLLRHIAVPRYDPSAPAHRRLASIMTLPAGDRPRDELNEAARSALTHSY